MLMRRTPQTSAAGTRTAGHTADGGREGRGDAAEREGGTGHAGAAGGALASVWPSDLGNILEGEVVFFFMSVLRTTCLLDQ